MVGTTGGVVAGMETSREAGAAVSAGGSSDRSRTVVSDAGEPGSQAGPISKNAANAAPIMYRVIPIAVHPLRVVAGIPFPTLLQTRTAIYANGSACGSVLYRFIAMLMPSASRHSTASAARSMDDFTAGCSSSENRPST